MNADKPEFLAPAEMAPADWAEFDRTGLPPRRDESAQGLQDELRAAGWPVDAADPVVQARREAEAERLERMSPDDHLNEIQEGRWQPRTR